MASFCPRSAGVASTSVNSPVFCYSSKGRILCEHRGRHAKHVARAAGKPTGSEAGSASASNKTRRVQQSSWDAKDASGTQTDKDYLYELGKAEYNINVDHGQNIDHLDSLYAGKFLGQKSDIADGSLRTWEFRTFDNIVGDYYVSPRFLEAVTMHIVKNYLADQGCFDGQTRVPLTLGIWGPKGQGKTFQTELAFRKLGVMPIIMSAGELEHEWAGTPGRLIRERYRKAAEMSRVHGKLSCLLINDIDAGIGHFANTQITVNNQNVVGTLMNICDDPNRVSIGQTWREGDWVRRIPLILTGNDFSTLFAPLVRDGRMEKFYWKPTGEDLVNIVHQMYKDDGVAKEDIAALLEVFPNQPLDFFGAVRAATYDNQIRDWIQEDVLQVDIAAEGANMAELTRRLINREGLPTFKPVKLTLKGLLDEGRRLATEQEHVQTMKLSKEYMKDTGTGPSLIGLKG